MSGCRPSFSKKRVERLAHLRKQLRSDNRPTSNREAGREDLLDDLEDRPLAVTRGGTREQSANSVNGLAAATDHATDVASSKLQFKDSRSAAWNFCQHHIVRKFNQLADDELEELSHALERLNMNPRSHNSAGSAEESEQMRNLLSPLLFRSRWPQRFTLKIILLVGKQTL